MPVPHLKSSSTEGRSLESDPDEPLTWRQDLPSEWRDVVIAPLTMQTYRDYEMAAERNLGYDEDEKACYIRSSFIVTEPRTDDDEEFYQVAAYAEIMTAWRLHDGRWLVHRVITREGERGHAFYSLGEHMPR